MSESENPALDSPEPKTSGRPRTNQDWWPNQLDLSVLHKHSPAADPMDEDFVRDSFEVEMLIEPYLTRWFVGIVTERELDALEAIEAEIETLNFEDPVLHSALDLRFHRLIYARHYNRNAAEIWWKHRRILGAVARSFPVSLSRRLSVVQEHRALIALIRAQDADGAAVLVKRHVENSGKHLVERMRAAGPR